MVSLERATESMPREAANRQASTVMLPAVAVPRNCRPRFCAGNLADISVRPWPLRQAFEAVIG